MVNILVADDDDTSRHMLVKWVKSWGYEVTECRDGGEAWEALQHNPPKVALLDWLMPEYSGTDLCKMYGRLDSSSFVYMIILARRAVSEDLFAAIDVGAHDYIPKPPSPTILKSRITAGVRLALEKDALLEANETMNRYAAHLEKMVSQRAKQLVHADRIATLGVMSAGIAHEINNPLSFIGGNIQTVERFWKEIEPIIKMQFASLPMNQSKDTSSQKMQFILDEMPRAIDSIKNGVSRVSSVVKNLKLYSGQQKTEKTESNLNECVNQALAISGNSIRKHISVEKKLANDLPPILANSREIEQVIVNLVVNAAHALEAKPSGLIIVQTRVNGSNIEIVVEDDGPGIPAEIVERIWAPFFTTKEVGKGTGLGLSVSQGIVREHHGEITVQNREAGGARFIVRLPNGKQANDNNSRVSSNNKEVED